MMRLQAVDYALIAAYIVVVALVVGLAWWLGTAGNWTSGMGMLTGCFLIVAYSHLKSVLR